MIAKFAEYRDQLDKADGVTLANALRVTVVSIQIEARACTTGGIEHNEYYGELRFHPGFGVKKPVAIPDEALGHRKIWREIAALAKNLDRPLRLKDVMAMQGTKDASRASHNNGIHRSHNRGDRREGQCDCGVIMRNKSEQVLETRCLEVAVVRERFHDAESAHDSERILVRTRDTINMIANSLWIVVHALLGPFGQARNTCQHC